MEEGSIVFGPFRDPCDLKVTYRPKTRQTANQPETRAWKASLKRGKRETQTSFLQYSSFYKQRRLGDRLKTSGTGRSDKVWNLPAENVADSPAQERAERSADAVQRRGEGDQPLHGTGAEVRLTPHVVGGVVEILDVL